MVFRDLSLCSLEVEDQLIFGRRLHGKFARFRALEDAIHILSCALELLGCVWPVGNEADD